jgi:hypothetical protein
MTTHDEQTDHPQAKAEVDPTAHGEPRGPSPEPSETTETEAPPTRSAEESTAEMKPPDARSEQSIDDIDSPTDEPLFADGTLSRLRSRWDDVQAAFVDDPKDCVQKADALVAQVVEQLTRGFSDARARLEDQWARGEEASTEDLRLALKRYRDFFQRLLSA